MGADRLVALERPRCKRCIKLDLSCGQYPPDWISYTPEPLPINDSLDRTSYDDANMKLSSAPTSVQIGQQRMLLQGLSPKVINIVPTLTEQNTSCGSMDDICVSYADAFLLRGLARFGTHNLPGLDRYNHDTLIKDSILGLSYTYYGRMHNNPSITKRGYEFYDSALKLLRYRLNRPDALVSIMECITLLSYYELFNGSNKQHLLNHATAFEAILKATGPMNVAQNLSILRLFEEQRRSIILAGILLSRPTILSQQQWTMVPWIAEGIQKPDVQYLWDTILDLSSLFHRDRGLTSSLLGRPKIPHEEAEGVLERLDLLFCGWSRKNHSMIYETDSTWVPMHCHDEVPWRTVFYFKTPEVADFYICYHTMSIILHRAILDSRLEAGLDTNAIGDHKSSIQQAALSICRASQYMLSDECSGIGMRWFGGPSRIVWTALSPSSAAAKFMLAAMEEYANKQRWAFVQALVKHLTAEVSA